MRFLAYHYERKVLYCHCEPAEGRRGNLKTSSATSRLLRSARNDNLSLVFY